MTTPVRRLNITQKMMKRHQPFFSDMPQGMVHSPIRLTKKFRRILLTYGWEVPEKLIPQKSQTYRLDTICNVFSSILKSTKIVKFIQSDRNVQLITV
jgi:hypothetical protein